MLSASILLVILIIGILLYALASNPKVSNLGLATFFAAMLAVCNHLSNHLVALIR